MPEFDLEQIVQLCTKDRAFADLMVNDLSYRITEDEKPESIMHVRKRAKRVYRGELERVRRHFNIWYADWFSQYPHIRHKENIRLVLAFLHTSFRAKSVQTRVHERTTWVQLAQKLQEEAGTRGQQETALDLAATVIARIDADGSPYEQLMECYDQVFPVPSGSQESSIFLPFFTGERGQMDFTVPIECRRHSFAGLCIDLLRGHIRDGGKHVGASDKRPWRIYSQAANGWQNLPLSPKLQMMQLCKQPVRVHEPSEVQKPGAAFVGDPKVRNVTERRSNQAYKPWDRSGTYERVGLKVTQCFFLGACREDVTLAWLARMAYEGSHMVRAGEGSGSDRMVKDHFYSLENKATSAMARAGGTSVVEPFPWSMHGWTDEDVMSIVSNACVWKLLTDVVDDNDDLYRWIADGSQGTRPQPPRGKKRTAPEEEEDTDVRSTLGTDGQTLGEQLKETQALMDVSKRQHEDLLEERRVDLDTDGVDAAPGDEAEFQAQGEPRELVPDDGFSPYYVAAGLGLLFAGAVYYSAGVTA